MTLTVTCRAGQDEAAVAARDWFGGIAFWDCPLCGYSCRGPDDDHIRFGGAHGVRQRVLPTGLRGCDRPAHRHEADSTHLVVHHGGWGGDYLPGTGGRLRANPLWRTREATP